MNNIFTRNLRSATFALTALALLLVPARAGAQQQFAQPAERTQFSDSEIDAFIRSQVQIYQLQQQYTGMLSQTTDSADQQSIMEEANREIMGVLESEGISLEVYNAIAEAASHDVELQGRLQQAMENMR